MTLSIAALLSVALAARASPVPAAPSGRSAAEWAAYNRARAQRGLLPRKATRGATRVSPALATTRTTTATPAPIAGPVPVPAATSVWPPHAGPRATGHGMREPGTGDGHGHGDGDGASTPTPIPAPARTAARSATVRHPSAAIARAAPERPGPSGAQVDLEGGVLRAGLDGASVEVRFVARVGGLTLAVERPAAPR
ncbi:hypothetical protein [Anaeromyxobacter oryzisoli]|uniref:hypothetical protein n=1 Tax=Anaeromyxobacter oryzisoli TaxID=2925408 RepID=UPI001F582D6D|nr:hypothetical protein [Anaeromyxobacter sp. SG63]